MVKIGVADKPEERRRMLQVGSPAILSILGVMETDDAPALERDLHQRFADLRAHGEWFRLDDAIRSYIAARSPELPHGCGVAFLRKQRQHEPPLLHVERREREGIKAFVSRFVTAARAAGIVVQA